MKHIKTLLLIVASFCGVASGFIANDFVANAQFVNTQKPSAPFVGNAGGLLPGPDQKEVAKDEDAATKYAINGFLPALTNILLVMIFLFGVPLLICLGLFFFLNEFSNDWLEKAKEGLFWFGLGTIISILGYAIVRLVVGINFLA